jgi:hypothetical protein
MNSFFLSMLLVSLLAVVQADGNSLYSSDSSFDLSSSDFSSSFDLSSSSSDSSSSAFDVSSCSSSSSSSDCAFYYSASSDCCSSSSSSCESVNCSRYLSATVYQPQVRGLQFMKMVQLGIASVLSGSGSSNSVQLALHAVAQENNVNIALNTHTICSNIVLLPGNAYIGSPATDFGFQLKSVSGVFIFVQVTALASSLPFRQIRIKQSHLRQNGW